MLNSSGKINRVLDHGSNIYLRNQEESSYSLNINNTIWQYEDGSQANRYKRVKLSEDGTYILIPSAEVLAGADSASNLVNGLVYNASLSAYGYTENKAGVLSEVSHAKKRMPDNFTMNALFDEQGNLRIYSNYDEWLENICLSSVYAEGGMMSRHGGQLGIINAERYRNMWLSNTVNANGGLRTEYELKTDDEGKNYIFISRETLAKASSRNSDVLVKGEKCYFRFFPYGIEQFTSDQEKEGEYVVLKEDLVKELPVFSVKENDNGDIVVSGSGEEYLAFARHFAQDYDAYLQLYANQTEYAANFFDRYYHSEHKPTISDDGTIIIPNAALLEHGVPCGEVRVIIYATGYKSYESTMVLRYACKETPAELTPGFDSDGNLVIKSSEPDWVDAFFAGDSDNNNNYIRLIVGTSWKYWISPQDCIKNGNSIVIKKDSLIAKSVEDGIYRLRISINGYANAFIDGVEIKDLLKEIDFKVDVYFENGDLIIRSDDKDYLDALTKESIREQKNGSWEWVQEYSNVNIYNANLEENRLGQGSTWYNEIFIYENGNESVTTKLNRISDDKVVIERELLLQDDGCFDNETTQIRLSSFGYPQITKSNISVTGVRKRYVPEKLDIYSDENGDLIIASNDDEWLKDLCIEEKHANNSYTVGGSVELIRYRIDGGWLSSEYIYQTANQHNLVYSPGKVTIKSDVLKKNNVKNGEYYVIVKPRNFMRIETSEPRLISGGNASNPTGISAKLETNGDLIIYSEDKNSNVDFLKNLVKPDVYGEDGVIVSNGGYVQVDGKTNGNWNIRNRIFEGSSSEKMVYDAEKNEVRISRTNIDYVSGDSTIRVYSYGYGGNDDRIEIPLELPYIVLESDERQTWKKLFQVDDIAKFKVETDKEVNWSVDDPEIASVNEDGVLTALKPGIVELSAQIKGSEYIDTVSITIDGALDIEKGAKLIVKAENYDSAKGIETGDSVQLLVNAEEEEIDPCFLVFSSDKPSVASVDQNGVIIAHKAGTAKIKVKLDGDPYKRSVVLTIKVINRILYSLSFETEDSLNTYYDDDNVLNICFDASTDLKKSFKITPYGKDDPVMPDESRGVVAEFVSYVPIDSSIASVAKDGTVTIKKAGQTTVKATVTSNPKDMKPVSNEFIIRVIDLAPKLESSKVTINKYYDDGIDVKIHAIKGSEIDKVEMVNAKNNEKDFIVAYVKGEDHFNIRQSDAIKAETKGKTYNETLIVTLTNGSEYEYKYTVVVNTALPKVSFKQSGIYNSALDISSLNMQVEVKDAEIRKVEFENEWASMDENGNILLLKEDSKGQKIRKGLVKVFFKGYNDERAFAKTTMNFKTSSALPVAALKAEDSTWFNKNTLTLNSNFITSYDLDVESSEVRYPIIDSAIKNGDKYEGLSVHYENNRIKVTRDLSVSMKNGTYKYVITPYISVGGVNKALKNVTLNIKVTDVAPKIVFSSSSVKLNKKYDEEIFLDVKSTDLPAGAVIDHFESNDETLETTFKDEEMKLAIRLKDRAALVKGSYKVELTPVYSNGYSGSPVKLTVKVLDVDAKATVSVKGNLNQFDPDGKDNCLGIVKLSNVVSEIKDIRINSDLVNAVYDEEIGRVIFTLKKNNIKDQTLKGLPVEIVLDSGVSVASTVTIKIARKAPAIKLETNKLNVYDTSYQNIEVGKIGLSELSYGRITRVWMSSSNVYDLEYKESDHSIHVVLKDAADMKVGSTSNITIKIDWTGDYGTYEQSLTDKSIKGLKTTTLKLTIKDASNTVKPK